MPELPDLLYIQRYLKREVVGKTIRAVEVKQPIVLRVAVDATFEEALKANTIADCAIHGPFLRFPLSPPPPFAHSHRLDLAINLMLAGKLQHQKEDEKPIGHLCFSLSLDDGSKLNLSDEQKMAKAYLVERGDYAGIPKYREQGVDIMGSGFKVQVMKELAAKHSRKQARVFINDHTILSSIGNAYADEILFDAKIHPKTFVAKLSEKEIEQLYNSIISVMKWGIEKVEQANQPIHVKVRDHMKVRNRKGESCPNCGTTIRREGVRGHDVFFCPKCQSATRRMFINWDKEN
jgi:formamidopyrimidine-DNA glycosylase